MEFDRYLELLRGDAARIAAVSGRGLDAAVPSCPGWTVEDVLRHLSEVYLHKVECMRNQAPPDPWPPDNSEREPLPLFGESFDLLLAELEGRGPDAPSYTWWPPNQTVGFWYRRMAQETAVHRMDVELAHDAVTPVDGELAADGIDEVLTIMLAGDWSDEPVEEAAGRAIGISADARSWRIGLDRTAVTCEAGAAGGTDLDAGVSGRSPDVLLWLWGRAPLDRLTTAGDPAVITALRDRLARATQ